MALQYLNPLSANPTKWSKSLSAVADKLFEFDRFVWLTLKGLTQGKLKFSFPTIFVNSEKLKIIEFGHKDSCTQKQ